MARVVRLSDLVDCIDHSDGDICQTTVDNEKVNKEYNYFFYHYVIFLLRGLPRVDLDRLDDVIKSDAACQRLAVSDDWETVCSVPAVHWRRNVGDE